MNLKGRYRRNYQKQHERIRAANLKTPEKLFHTTRWKPAMAGFTAGAVVIGIVIAALKLWCAG